MAAPKPLSEGFSPDGYIIDQDCLSQIEYRTMPASINGCGWVAAFDLLRFLDGREDWDEVRRELDGMHRLRMPGPTLTGVMRRYLAAHVPQIREVSGREEALAAARESRAGIFRYREGMEPHFVCYLRAEAGYRFFNVSDGLEDAVLSMEQFGAEHLRGGTVVLFYMPRESAEDVATADGSGGAAPVSAAAPASAAPEI